MSNDAISGGLSLIFSGIERLNAAFPNRAFTIDGRLVGDVGEVIAALEFDLVLHQKCEPKHDATTSDGRHVQIKATFKESLTFRVVPDYFLGLKLYPDGKHDVVFNGPGSRIYERYRDRKGIGVNLLSFPIAELQRLSAHVPEEDRVPRRAITHHGTSTNSTAG